MEDDHGIILIDKPANVSSAKVVSRVKKAIQAKKAGHAGTLDPFATGLMICCVNRGTRLARFFLSGAKTYEAVLQLGVETDTQDFTGRVLATHAVPDVSTDRIAALLETFVGESLQTPPVYSALKHAGKPLYKYARQGKPVQKPARRIVISEIRLHASALPLVRFEVACSAGTYIRTLCADIGRALGCGAHLKALRRLETCGFSIGEAVTLETFEAAAYDGKRSSHVIPLAEALPGMPAWTPAPLQQESILNGVPLAGPDAPPADMAGSDGRIKVVSRGGELLAVLEYKKERQQYDYCCVFN